MTDHQVARILLRLTALWPRQRTADELRAWWETRVDPS